MAVPRGTPARYRSRLCTKTSNRTLGQVMIKVRNSTVVRTNDAREEPLRRSEHRNLFRPAGIHSADNTCLSRFQKHSSLAKPRYGKSDPSLENTNNTTYYSPSAV